MKSQIFFSNSDNSMIFDFRPIKYIGGSTFEYEDRSKVEMLFLIDTHSFDAMGRGRFTLMRAQCAQSALHTVHQLYDS